MSKLSEQYGRKPQAGLPLIGVLQLPMPIAIGPRSVVGPTIRIDYADMAAPITVWGGIALEYRPEACVFELSKALLNRFTGGSR